MDIKSSVQVSVYKDIMDLQKELVNSILQMLPNQSTQIDTTDKVQEVQKQTPPPNLEGTISKYA